MTIPNENGKALRSTPIFLMRVPRGGRWRRRYRIPLGLHPGYKAVRRARTVTQ